MSFLKTIARLNSSQNNNGILMNELGIYMFDTESHCDIVFNKADSRLNLDELSKVLKNIKANNMKDYQVLRLLEHSVKFKATKAVKLFTLLQKKALLEKYLPMTTGLLKERLEFYLRVKNWQSLYKDSNPPLSKIVSKQQHAMVFR